MSLEMPKQKAQLSLVAAPQYFTQWETQSLPLAPWLILQGSFKC